MIYPIAQMIDDLMTASVDQETGEVVMSDEELEEKLQGLQMEFNDKVDSLCCLAKNAKASASDIKAEKMNLAKRQKSEENTAERAKRFLAYLLQGEKFKNSRHNLYYLSSEQIVIDDREELTKWAQVNAPGFLNQPTLREDDIKKALKNGADIPFCHIEKNKSVVIR